VYGVALNVMLLQQSAVLVYAVQYASHYWMILCTARTCDAFSILFCCIPCSMCVLSISYCGAYVHKAHMCYLSTHCIQQCSTHCTTQQCSTHYTHYTIYTILHYTTYTVHICDALLALAVCTSVCLHAACGASLQQLPTTALLLPALEQPRESGY
jgi:hypothetical protein